MIADYYAAYATGDMGRVAAFFADDIEWHIPGHHPLANTKRGKEEVGAFFEQLGKANFRAELISLMADENWVIDMHRGWSDRDGLANVDTTWVLAFRIARVVRTPLGMPHRVAAAARREDEIVIIEGLDAKSPEAFR